MSIRVALIGPGAVGGSVAAWVAQREDVELILCVRTPFDRLIVETPSETLDVVARMLTEPGLAEPVDWVLVATKTYDAAATIPWLERLVGPETRMAVLQNGVEHVERFSDLVPAARIVPVIVDIPAERSEPGRIQQRRYGSVIVPAGRNGDDFVGLFEASPIEAVTTEDWITAAWFKLSINCAGAVSALTLQPAGVSRREPIARIMRALVSECAAVGRAEGASLADDIAEEVVMRYRSGPADSINSLQADRMAGRPMESDARHGVIVRRGRIHGIPTPMNEIALALLEASTG
jgi:2-dehydropantoate 2-reductase